MKTAKNQSIIRKSLQTSTPISENVATKFLPSLKPLSIIKPSNRNKKSANSYYDTLGMKKRSKAKGFNLPHPYNQCSSDNESCKENSMTPSTNVSSSKRASRRPKSSALKPLNTLKNSEKISGISPIHPDFWNGKRYRSSHENSNFDLNTCVISLKARRSKSSALKPLNTLENCQKIFGISPIHPESWCGKRHRSSNENSNFDLNKGVISLNRSKDQNSRNSGYVDLFSRMQLASRNRPSSPFLTARNNCEVKGNVKEENVSLNEEAIFKNTHAARNKRSTLVESTDSVVPRRSKSNIVKKVRFSDKVETLGAKIISHNNLNSGNTPVKIDKTGLDPYGVEELLEFLEDKRTLLNEKEARSSVSDIQHTKKTKINGMSGIKESEKCVKKFTKVGGASEKDKTSQAIRTKLKNNRENSKKEKDRVTSKTRKNLHSKSNNRIQQTVDEKERLDRDLNISTSLNTGINSKLSSTTVNRAMNTEMDEEEVHSTNEKDCVNNKTRKNLHPKNNNRVQCIVDDKDVLDRDINISESLNIGNNSKLKLTTVNTVMDTELDEAEVPSTNENDLYLNILKGAEGSQKNGTIDAEDFVNNYDKKKSDNKNDLLLNQTKETVIDKKAESKQKEGETASKDLELLEENVLFPPTSTPFDSPEREAKELSSNFLCLSPILEQQPEIVSDTFCNYEPSVVWAEKTYGKYKLRNISKEEKLWSLIATRSSVDTIAETFSATKIAEGPKEQEENAEDVLLFETPPVKKLTGQSFECKKQHKDKDKKMKKKTFSHKKNEHIADKRTERKPENKISVRKMENSIELSSQQRQLSNHFEDVFAWNLCIERKESKRKFFSKKTYNAEN